MLATGGSASHSITVCKEAGARDVRLLSLIAAPEGIERVLAEHPDVTIYTAGIDRGLDEQRLHPPGSRRRGRPAVRQPLTSDTARECGPGAGRRRKRSSDKAQVVSVVLGTSRRSRKALRRRIRPIEMVIADRPTTQSSRRSTGRAGSKDRRWRARKGCGRATRGSFEPAPPEIFVAHVRRGLTAITVATDRKRLVDATCGRGAIAPRPHRYRATSVLGLRTPERRRCPARRARTSA